MIVVTSIHHSGTHFVLDHLLADFERLHDNTAGMPVQPINGKVHVHCEPCYLNKLEWWLDRFKCIVPLRHPQEIVKSWLTRDGKNLLGLYEQMRMLESLSERFRLNFLPLDMRDRESCLQQINWELGLNLSTDWPIIMSNGKVSKFDSDPDGLDRQMVDSLMSFSFNQRFYARDDHVLCQYPETTEPTSGRPAAA